RCVLIAFRPHEQPPHYGGVRRRHDKHPQRRRTARARHVSLKTRFRIPRSRARPRAAEWRMQESRWLNYIAQLFAPAGGAGSLVDEPSAGDRSSNAFRASHPPPSADGAVIDSRGRATITSDPLGAWRVAARHQLAVIVLFSLVVNFLMLTLPIYLFQLSD